MNRYRGSLVIFLAGVILATATAAQTPPEPPEIDRAVAAGIEYLSSQQQPNGTWSYRFNQDHRLGITCLAGLALLENGTLPGSPSIERAASFARSAIVESDQTYDVSLAILFLSRLQNTSRGPDDERIVTAATRLALGHNEGQWSYTIPMSIDSEGDSRSRASRGPGDNSNTQFALLGIWAAGRHGFPSDETLAAIDSHFRRSQDGDGSWGYSRGASGTEAMTCAGLMGLAIAAARPSEAERLSSRARGQRLAADPAFVNGLARVAHDAESIRPGIDLYYLWSLERVSVALGLTRLDGRDWYAAGAEVLLREQQPDGSWPDGRWGKLPNTCLALLFLRKSNLAFELDRVLRLPSEEPPGHDAALSRVSLESGSSEPAPETVGDDGVQVIVRGTDEREFPVIQIDFEVRDRAGEPLLDAKREEFRLVEYDQPVEILSFDSPLSTEIRPTTVVLVVDTSKSMELEEDRMTPLKQAVASFLEVVPEGSQVAVVAFNSDVRVLVPFTADRTSVLQKVQALQAQGGTRYYDAVATALDLIAETRGRRAILALTDGEDTFSRDASLDQVIARARTAGVPVHTLGVGTEDEIASDELKQLAAQTRGRYFPAREANALVGIFEEVARNLGSTYSLTYRSDRKLPDGTLRPVQIFYREARTAAGTAEVFIRGMVVPTAQWPGLFLILVAGLGTLAWLPGYWRRRKATPNLTR